MKFLQLQKMPLDAELFRGNDGPRVRQATRPRVIWPRWASWALLGVVVTTLLTIAATLNASTRPMLACSGSKDSAREVQRYGRVAIALHWLIAQLIAVNWPLGYFGELIEQQYGRSLVAVHKSLGLTILGLSLLRLGWRLSHRPPAIPAAIGGWRRGVARLVHAAFYVLMIALPLTGWLRISAGKYPLAWFGLVELPKFPVTAGSPQAALAAATHEVLAWAMLILVMLHVSAALHHHFRLRDEVLLRMAPIFHRRN